MSFIPHTKEDTQAMLEAIGIDEIDDLFDEIPDEFKVNEISGIPDGLSELQVTREICKRADRDTFSQNYIGAGAYEHYIPAAIWEITTRGEFYTSYTPYQAEASQGTLQLIYEYQSMMASLMGHEVSNASLYDGATSLAEAILMAIRVNKNKTSKKILFPRSINPLYREVVKTITSYQGIDLISAPFKHESGSIDKAQLDQYDDITAIVIQQPNFFGSIEDVDEITNWAQERGILVIALVNPLAMTLIKPPGDWGSSGADIACGEGQPLGIPLSSGGPYYGFMTCKKGFIRQMPGRIVGKTIDNRGNEGFTLTLQAREQHIRRSKATSNICTNQGLMVTASTIYMSLMGPTGLTEVAKACHSKLNEFIGKVTQLEGVDLAFKSINFHEVVLKLSVPAEEVIIKLESGGISPGIALGEFFPELKNTLLVCVTEVKTSDDIDEFIQMIGRAIKDFS
jgi:glycine dehydrogenase subunit 1